jgi:hypothetical protein
MTEIAWRMLSAGPSVKPIVDPPMTRAAGRLPLTREYAPLYVRSIAETFFAGRSGQEAWEAVFGEDEEATVLIEVTAPSEMAGRYEVCLGRRVSVACVRPFRGRRNKRVVYQYSKLRVRRTTTG